MTAFRNAIRPALRTFDPFIAAMSALIAPLVFLVCRAGKDTPLTRAFFDRIGVAFVRRHYYEPVIDKRDIHSPLSQERALPGVDLNEDQQMAFVAEFNYADELRQFPMEKPSVDQFGYLNRRYGPGDAEILYSFIRRHRPKRIIEVGSGQSTLMARAAIDANKKRDSDYHCDMICIEPYEEPWLERIGVNVIRDRVENCPAALTETLGPGDLLFIDSSHVIRPQGDVLHLFLGVLPRLATGVYIQIHDIFTPRDYPAEWILEDRRIWNEQYLLEAFLTHNPQFEVMLALNWFASNHRAALDRVCPILATRPNQQPGAFWMRRR